MGRKKVIFVLLVAVIVLISATVHAENRWGDFRVLSVGPAYGSMYILLQGVGDNPPFGERWCTPNAGQEREMLAIALTAMANGLNVHACIDVNLSATVYTIHAFYLLGQ